ncbi:hypothetical protein PUN28_012454 [Cardiocondyla obscurior]|uniref:Major facilitator superfamily (MFS) profile domain-containing protein n=1 Tax=Cardiocondyla obscurior TaxID=286306 RepID=A0AAW2FEY1_9HYME
MTLFDCLKTFYRCKDFIRFIIDYKWNKLQKDLLLSSYFWGHLVTQIPFGYFADIWSSQKIFAFGAIICGVFNMLIPVAARFTDLEGVIVCRIGMGLTMAGLLPCTQSLLSKWAPPAERSRLGTFSYSGGQFGTVITLIVAGVLAESSLGWPSIFYMLGALAIVWGIAFLWFGADSPSVHRSISQEERMYIEESLKTSEAERNEKKKIKTPWKEIFTSKPMWAIIIAHSAQNWGYVTLLTEIPSYMSGVMKYKSMTVSNKILQKLFIGNILIFVVDKKLFSALNVSL